MYKYIIIGIRIEYIPWTGINRYPRYPLFVIKSFTCVIPFQSDDSRSWIVERDKLSLRVILRKEGKGKGKRTRFHRIIFLGCKNRLLENFNNYDFSLLPFVSHIFIICTSGTMV